MRAESAVEPAKSENITVTGAGLELVAAVGARPGLPEQRSELEPSIWFAEDFDTVDLNGLRRCCRSLSS